MGLSFQIKGSHMYLKVDPRNPAPRHLKIILDKLREGGLIIYPTDTVYAVGCDLNNREAIEKLAKVTGKKAKIDHFSLICPDLSTMSRYTVPFEDRKYKLMKRLLPGPVTFILKTNKEVPKLFKNSKKTIGIRIPDHPVPRAIAKEWGSPLITTSLNHNDDDIVKYHTDPEEIHERFKNHVSLVIDGGPGNNTSSSIIDCSGDEIEVLRDNQSVTEMVG